MKIVFALNTTGLTGGVKVVFEHANRLQARGHQVFIVHLLRLKKGYYGWLICQLKLIKYFLLKIVKKNDKIKWFSLNQNIKVLRLDSLNKLKDFNAIIATANETADWVAALSVNNNKKFYFIQDYETWTRDIKMVDATYKLPLKKIVISNWLKGIIANKFKEEVSGVVLNGINYKDFYCKRIKCNKNKKILMLYHFLPKKGVDIGLKAYYEIKKLFPKVELTMFGMYYPEKEILKDIKFFYNPNAKIIRELYCSADIFLFPSIVEGFGLTPMEAMASKCAVVATSVGGIPDYTINNKTALVVSPGKVEPIVQALKKLILNEETLKRIANSGNEYIKNFTWEKATTQFENILINETSN